MDRIEIRTAADFLRDFTSCSTNVIYMYHMCVYSVLVVIRKSSPYSKHILVCFQIFY